MRAHVPLAAVVALAFLLLACSGSGDRAATIRPTVTPVVEMETTEAEGATPSPPAEVDPAAVAAKLPQALLTLEDMPTGWTITPTDEEEDDGTPICGLASQEFAEEAVAREAANFQESEFGPLLAQIIDLFAEGEAEPVMAEFAGAFGSCTEWTDVAEDGTETDWRLSPLSFPKIGDETFAFRMSTITFLGAAEIDFIVWRRSDVVEVIGHTAIGLEGVDSEQTEAFARLADDRLREILD